ncbi:uncharacterized protein METZ01_LOCUS4691 [marine metagenome]|uniref:Uncharacterized protein n=1 Tax=marine metagenome TaxID=408172 RepID=A0A381NBE1_9ZZZZ
MFSINLPFIFRNPFSLCRKTKVIIVDPFFYTAEQMKADNKYWEEFFAKTSITKLNAGATPSF